MPASLVAVPNFSEARDPATLDAIADAFTRAGARLLGERHADLDHGRAVFTLAAPPRVLADALVAGARVALDRIDLRAHTGAHPHVGVLDVAPVVFLEEDERGAACAEALVTADRLAGELGLPVFLYGLLAGGRTRAELRAGGLQGLVGRGTRPDFGPREMTPRSGATLVAARPPLVAFNLELAPPATVDDARAIAARIREGGPAGLPGVRALGLALRANRDGPTAQVTCNVEDHQAVPLARLLAAVRDHAPVQEAELVGLAPRAAFAGWPQSVPVRNRAILEDLLS